MRKSVVIELMPVRGKVPDAGTTTSIDGSPDAGTTTPADAVDDATTTAPSDAVTTHVYVAPGVSPPTVTGDVVPVAEPVTPPSVDVHVAVYESAAACADTPLASAFAVASAR